MPIEVDTEKLADYNTPLPTRAYTVVVREVKQAPNKKKTAAQDEFECEVLAPDSVEFAGVLSAAAGRTFSLYATYSHKNLSNCKTGLAKLGFIVPKNITMPTEDEVASGALTRINEIQEVTVGFKNCVFDITLSTEPIYKTDTGKWDGKRVKDEHGQDIIQGYRLAMPGLSDITGALRTMDGENPF